MVWLVDIRGMIKAISGFAWIYLLAGLASLALDYAARIARWRMMLSAAGAQVSIRGCAAAFLGSVALNNILPARLGDVVRALVFPAAIGVTKTISTGSLVMERLVDLATILVFLIGGIATFGSTELPAGIRTSAIILAAVSSIALLGLFLFSGALSELCRRAVTRNFGRYDLSMKRLLVTLAGLFGSFEAMSRPRTLVGLFFLSVVIWAGEAGLFWALLVGFGFPAGPAAAAITMAIATLATLVPSSPGYVGPFHLAAFAAISMLGGQPDQAASFAVLAHAALWLPTTAVGLLFILINPSLFAADKLSSAAKAT